MTDRPAVSRRGMGSGADQVNDPRREMLNARITKSSNVGPINVAAVERPNSRHIENLVIVRVGGTENCGSERVDAELTNHAGHDLRITFVGFSEYIWKVAGVFM